MTPKCLKIIHAWPNTDHFCKGGENEVAQELAFRFVEVKAFWISQNWEWYDHFMINCDKFGFTEWFCCLLNQNFYAWLNRNCFYYCSIVISLVDTMVGRKYWLLPLQVTVTFLFSTNHIWIFSSLTWSPSGYLS